MFAQWKQLKKIELFAKHCVFTVGTVKSMFITTTTATATTTVNTNTTTTNFQTLCFHSRNSTNRTDC